MEEKLKKILECGICLNVVHVPKQLACGHSFCKTCLENVLKFSHDGSASIKCPNKCETTTFISATQTLNDLQNNYMLINAAELASAEDDSIGTAEGRCAKCSREAQKYCIECSKFICGRCPDEHDGKEACFVGVSFREARDRKGVIYCKEHSSEAVYSCCETEHLCRYCVRRSAHRNHNYQRLVWVDEFLKKQMQLKIYANATPGFVKRKEDAMQLIEIAKENLDQELACRKRKCIETYTGYLDEEERKVKSELDQIGKQYLSAFESIEFFKDTLQKEHFDIILLRRKILDRMNSFYIDSVNGIPGIVVSLGEKISSDAKPLGVLKTVPCNDASCRKFQSNFVASGNNETFQEQEEPEKGIGEQLKQNRRKRKLSATKNNTDAHPGSMENHICQSLPIAAMPAKSIKKSVHCSFKVQHTAKIFNNVYSDPVALQDWVFTVSFGLKHKDIEGNRGKYAGICFHCENKSGDHSHWPQWCNVDITLKHEQSGKDISRSFSPILGNNLCTLVIFGKWDDILNPRQGFLLLDESLDIHIVIEISAQ